MPTNEQLTALINPVRFLRGTFATSYLGYIHGNPAPAPPAPGPPQIPAYILDANGVPIQTHGYRFHTVAGNFFFDGNGNLEAELNASVAAATAVLTSFTGKYTVQASFNAGGVFYTGTFYTLDAGGIRVEYYFAMSDNGTKLHANVSNVSKTNTTPMPVARPFIVACTLHKVNC